MKFLLCENKLFSHVKKIVLLITISFLLPSISWTFDAAYQVGNAQLIKISSLNQTLKIPEKIGQIQKQFLGQGKTIIHIQDLHCNYEVQHNIAEIIKNVAKESGLELIGVEGAFDVIDTAKLGTFSQKRVREEVSDYFVKQGKLTGAEYYAINAQKQVKLIGVESAELYKQKSIDVFPNSQLSIEIILLWSKGVDERRKM